MNLTNGMNVTGPNSFDKKQHVNANDELRARQLMARYLYVLARLFIDDKFLISPDNKWFENDPFDPSINTDSSPYGKKYKASVRRIAEWAVNVVDFMDADSICTPFEYDLYPFSAVDPTNGLSKDLSNPGSKRTWCVDGIVDDGSGTFSQDDVKSWRGLVWGCERPELLITETGAFHDRRTEDRDDESPDMLEPEGNKKAKVTDMMTPDTSFDQRLMPRSGFFVELYNPWANNGPFQPAEFYSNVINNGNSGVLLNAVSGGGKPSPIWRLLVVKDNPTAPKVREILTIPRIRYQRI